MNTRNKLQALFTNKMFDSILTSSWLTNNGYSPQLVKSYCEHQWLTPIARGAFLRCGEELTWQAIVHAIQQQQKNNIHLAARSALKAQGIYHYVRVKFDLMLCAPHNTKLPAWVKLACSDLYPLHYATYTWLQDPQQGLIDYNVDNVTLSISSLERAMLEVCALFPQYYGYEEATYLMESLNNLPPEKVQALLENSTNIKANRLFLHLASECDHAWLKELNTSQIELGHGNRVLPGATRFDKTYKLYVPDTPLNEGLGKDNVIF
jgi:Holliday junction resolvase-like predicted endonuclease